ncbi:MAG: metallophosphoesterase family protein [Marinilabiliaceae bacterium]|nr:metallophosphoesterase family protein [Marinilabiliaceae bacterium]
MKKIISISLLLFIFIGSQAQKLKFNQNGNFKIVQFTDLHFLYSTQENVLNNLNKVLDIEQPDLVIITGDLMSEPNYAEGFDVLIQPIVERQINWCVVFGNHDHELDLTRSEINELISKYPYNVNGKNPTGVYGDTNYLLEVKESHTNKTGALIYCMDSNTYSEYDHIEGYGWFDHTQIDWYVRTSEKFKKKKLLPALSFFHIPLPEFHDAKTINDDGILGEKEETVCTGKINSGLFSAFLRQKDVMGIFVGHDHLNDYIASYYGIALAYCRYSGSTNMYGLKMNGARVIELKEGERVFDTWIRLRSGDRINEYHFQSKCK